MTDTGLRSPSRRRCLTILAGATADTLLRIAAAHADGTYEWQGTALGADARIILGADGVLGVRQTIMAARKEIARLENIFSLYRTGSAINRLNADGLLDPAPLELLDLMRRSLYFTEISTGAFDITVQPLWDLYARHFRDHPAQTTGPRREAVAAARARVGPDRVCLTATGIALAPGTRVTFNGIAQGYITDRVADLFRMRGWRHVLIDLGELRAVDDRPGGGPWRIALPGGRMIEMSSDAVATSSPDGLRFTAGGAHHLMDPRTGRPARARSSVSVAARTATDADALSTTLSVLEPEKWQTVLDRVPGARVL